VNVVDSPSAAGVVVSGTDVSGDPSLSAELIPRVPHLPTQPVPLFEGFSESPATVVVELRAAADTTLAARAGAPLTVETPPSRRLVLAASATAPAAMMPVTDSAVAMEDFM